MAVILTNNPASMEEIRELNLAILNWIPKVRSKLKNSVLQFRDGKSQSFIIRKRKVGKQKEFKLAYQWGRGILQFRELILVVSSIRRRTKIKDIKFVFLNLNRKL